MARCQDHVVISIRFYLFLLFTHPSKSLNSGVPIHQLMLGCTEVTNFLQSQSQQTSKLTNSSSRQNGFPWQLHPSLTSPGATQSSVLWTDESSFRWASLGLAVSRRTVQFHAGNSLWMTSSCSNMTAPQCAKHIKTWMSAGPSSTSTPNSES